VSTSPEAFLWPRLRVGLQVGSFAAQPSGSSRADNGPAGLALRFFDAQSRTLLPPGALGLRRSITVRACGVLRVDVRNSWPGEAGIFFTSATSSGPSAAPCALPVFILVAPEADDRAQHNELGREVSASPPRSRPGCR